MRPLMLNVFLFSLTLTLVTSGPLPYTNKPWLRIGNKALFKENEASASSPAGEESATEILNLHRQASTARIIPACYHANDAITMRRTSTTDQLQASKTTIMPSHTFPSVENAGENAPHNLTCRDAPSHGVPQPSFLHNRQPQGRDGALVTVTTHDSVSNATQLPCDDTTNGVSFNQSTDSANVPATIVGVKSPLNGNNPADSIPRFANRTHGSRPRITPKPAINNIAELLKHPDHVCTRRNETNCIPTHKVQEMHITQAALEGTDDEGPRWNGDNSDARSLADGGSGSGNAGAGGLAQADHVSPSNNNDRGVFHSVGILTDEALSDAFSPVVQSTQAGPDAAFSPEFHTSRTIAAGSGGLSTLRPASGELLSPADGLDTPAAARPPQSSDTSGTGDDSNEILHGSVFAGSMSPPGGVVIDDGARAEAQSDLDPKQGSSAGPHPGLSLGPGLGSDGISQAGGGAASSDHHPAPKAGSPGASPSLSPPHVLPGGQKPPVQAGQPPPSVPAAGQPLPGQPSAGQPATRITNQQLVWPHITIGGTIFNALPPPTAAAHAFDPGHVARPPSAAVGVVEAGSPLSAMHTINEDEIPRTPAISIGKAGPAHADLAKGPTAPVMITHNNRPVAVVPVKASFPASVPEISPPPPPREIDLITSAGQIFSPIPSSLLSLSSSSGIPVPIAVLPTAWRSADNEGTVHTVVLPIASPTPLEPAQPPASTVRNSAGISQITIPSGPLAHMTIATGIDITAYPDPQRTITVGSSIVEDWLIPLPTGQSSINPTTVIISGTPLAVIPVQPSLETIRGSVIHVFPASPLILTHSDATEAVVVVPMAYAAAATGGGTIEAKGVSLTTSEGQIFAVIPATTATAFSNEGPVGRGTEIRATAAQATTTVPYPIMGTSASNGAKGMTGDSMPSQANTGSSAPTQSSGGGTVRLKISWPLNIDSLVIMVLGAVAMRFLW